MLRYIVEKNGGIVIWNEGNKSASVYLNGKLAVFSADNYDIVNGRMLVENGILMNIFGLTLDQASHNAFDEFYSSDDTALSFGLRYQREAQSKETTYNGNPILGVEAGAFIHESPTGKYYYATPFWGGHNNVVLGLFENTHAGQQYIRNEQVGIVHIHPACPPSCHLNNQFSDQDIWYSDKLNLIMYVITPEAGMLIHIPSR